jgi:hypothetical protein
MTIIPCSHTFDQPTMTLMLEHDPLVQRYRAFFALFNWRVVPEPPIDPSQPGSDPIRHAPTSRPCCSSWNKT